MLADRADGAVVRHGDAVAKAHADDTDPAGAPRPAGRRRAPLLAGILLPPLRRAHRRTSRAGPSPRWPYGTPVDPDDPDAAPWEAGRDTCGPAALRPPGAVPPAGPVPPMRGPAKAARALARMRAVGRRPGGRPGRAGLGAAARLGQGRGARPRARRALPRRPASRPARTPPRARGPLAAHRRGRPGDRRPRLGLGPPGRLVRGRAALPGRLAAIPRRLPCGARPRRARRRAIPGPGSTSPPAPSPSRGRRSPS